MKYKTVEHYSITASGGQMVTTEQVPVYNRFEKMAMRRRDKREQKLKGKSGGVDTAVAKGVGQILKSNPYILLILAIILLAFIIYTVYSVNSTLDKLIYQYTHLTDTAVMDSKAQFDKKLFYVKTNSDGTTSIVLGFSSEVQQEELQRQIDEIGDVETTLDVNINGWYTDVAAGTEATTSKSAFAPGSTLAIYDGPPWDVKSGSYIFNYPQARYDTYEMFEGLGVKGNPINTSNMYSAAVVGGASQNARFTEHGFDSNGLKTVGGVVCLNFCPMPTLVDRTWINNWTQGATCDSSKYGFGEARYAAILVDKHSGDVLDSSTWKYLPLCPNDAKAHTYPWGVVQTNIKIMSTSELQFSRNWSGTTATAQYNKQYSDGIGTDDSIKDALLTISDDDYDSNFGPTVDFDAYSWWNHALELYGQGNSIVNAFDNYWMVGIMYFGEG